MRTYVNGGQVVIVNGKNAAEAVESLMTQFLALRIRTANGSGELRPFVNFFFRRE
jgi:hypothetical protein